jgi:hypothetical protein
MLVGPRIEVKAIKSDAVGSDRDDGYGGAHLAVEAVLVHAEIPRRIAKPEQSRDENGCSWLRVRAQALIWERFVESFGRLRG